MPSDLERELHRRGQELIRQLLQGHLDQRGPGEAAGPVAGADGVERPERRVHDRRLETTFGTVDVERMGYGRAGHDSLHPLDTSLNLPPERYSLEVRRRVAEAAASMHSKRPSPFPAAARSFGPMRSTASLACCTPISRVGATSSTRPCAARRLPADTGRCRGSPSVRSRLSSGSAR